MIAGILVVGSYFAARHIRVRRPLERGERPAVRPDAPPAELQPARI